MSEFGKTYTVEQFKTANKTSKLFFNYAVQRASDGTLQPLCYRNADGSMSDVQKVAVLDDAKNTIAWASKSVAADIKAGKPLANLAVTEVVTDDGVIHNTLCHPSTSNIIEGLSL